MKLTRIILSTAFIIAMIVSSCNKNEGCTDSAALNYDADAKEDDGSCIYPEPSPHGTITDQDGNTYATILIGTQVWMAENLRTNRFCNGDSIPNEIDNWAWESSTSGAWAHYNNNSQYDTTYGKLYNWFAVDDSRNICPCGWHVPSDEEWTLLIDFLGGKEVAGGKMKSTGTQYWQNPNTDATNESGFSSLPGGYRSTYRGIYFFMGVYGYWWSSSESALGYYLFFDNSVINMNPISKRNGLSVRCIKD